MKLLRLNDFIIRCKCANISIPEGTLFIVDDVYADTHNMQYMTFTGQGIIKYKPIGSCNTTVSIIDNSVIKQLIK